MLRHAGPLPAVNTRVAHHTKTTGLPAFSKARRPNSDKFRLAKAEMEYMMELGTIHCDISGQLINLSVIGS